MTVTYYRHRRKRPKPKREPTDIKVPIVVKRLLKKRRSLAELPDDPEKEAAIKETLRRMLRGQPNS